MVETTSRAAPRLKNIGASCSQNSSNTSSRKYCKKDGSDKPFHDKGDDAISSQQKSMSHLGQEEGQKMVDTPSRAAHGLKIIGTSRSQNTSYTSSRKECEKDGADKPFHDDGDDAISSQQKSMSHIGQEYGQKMLETLSRAAPRLKMIGDLCSQNSSNTSSRK